ncbi:cytochrome c oxidase subunit II [Candidatus Magnetominusculus dajiuhuensis]|uniref:cytochrome c oxidase subunit II n=1 Tax=Candidatus Magnetominusculus dajiuhuensis TaxID=3137712 RepID=UPI0019EB352C|nr:cytochrome c oxidase subunit II [Nitrospirota bacterium]
MLKQMVRLLTAALFVSLPYAAAAAERVADPVKAWNNHFKTWAVVSIVVYLVVTVPLIYFVFKYKRRHKDETGAYIVGNTALEILWTIVPMIIIIMLGVQSWAVFNDLRDVPKDHIEVKAVGFMYGFEMYSPEGIKTINELRVPVGNVKVNLSSKDVIHDFALPAFRTREDMVPGENTYLWFSAKEPGEYPVYCAEYCGSGHSSMLAKVIVMKQEDYDAWVKKQKGEGTTVAALTPETKGKELVERLGCLGCHGIAGEIKAGPALNGVIGKSQELEDGTKVVIDEAFVKEKIADPKAKPVKGFGHIMPPNALAKEEYEAIAAYINTLK